MPEIEHRNWRELCNAALEAKDPDELLKVLQQLNKALKREEQVRREFREAVRAIQSSAEGRINKYTKSNGVSRYQELNRRAHVGAVSAWAQSPLTRSLPPCR